MVAYRAGALPSIVEHGVTGFIVDDVPGMTAALRDVGRLRPQDCRAAALARFDLRATAGRYLDLYHRLAA